MQRKPVIQGHVSKMRRVSAEIRREGGKRERSLALVTAARKNLQPLLNPKQPSQSPAAPRPLPHIHSANDPTLRTASTRHRTAFRKERLVPALGLNDFSLFFLQFLASALEPVYNVSFYSAWLNTLHHMLQA